MSGGVQTSPASTARIAAPIPSMPTDFGMKPEAPNSMARRMTTASSVADTITKDGAIARVLSNPAATDYVSIEPVWMPKANGTPMPSIWKVWMSNPRAE